MPRFIISGGGTGGHIFPAIAIANELKFQDPTSEILFVGAQGRMEMQKVPLAGYPIEGLWISGLQRKLTVDNLSFPVKVVSSILKSRRIIKNFKPDAAIGVGGYASGPLLYAATQLRIPTLIQEQNGFAGLTNKWLSKRVNKICVAYEGMEKFFPQDKIILTGNPVRKDILDIKNKSEEALQFFDLNAIAKTILIIGGSLGARTINKSIFNGISVLVEQGVQIIWQTGKGFYEKATSLKQEKFSKQVKVYDFINRMDLAYSMADLVISRAGALSITELCNCAKAAILVPSPNVTEDHQTQNALALVNKGAAVLIKDQEAQEKLIDTTVHLLRDQSQIEQLKKNILGLAKPDATKDIVSEILGML